MVYTFAGTANLTPSDFVGTEFVNSSAFFGNNRIPAWPALPHHLKLHGATPNVRIARIAALAFTAGLLASFIFIIYLAYAHGGQNLHTAPFSGRSNSASVRLYSNMTNHILNEQKLFLIHIKWPYGSLAYLKRSCSLDCEAACPGGPCTRLASPFKIPLVQESTASPFSHLGGQVTFPAYRRHCPVPPRSTLFYWPASGLCHRRHRFVYCRSHLVPNRWALDTWMVIGKKIKG